jgi:2-hydroxychromene-2-carboxylate isomerase
MRIPFYYDYACPWAFFASCRAEEYFADHEVEIDFTPVRLRHLVEPTPGAKPGPGNMPPRKQAHYMKDFLRWAAFTGAEISPAALEHMKVDTAPALRVALAAKDADVGGKAFRRLHHAIYRARWCEGRDVSPRDLLAECIDAAGLDVDPLLELAESKACAGALDEQTRDAVERGVFGVPTLFVGDEMFWGNDRFELVRHHIRAAQQTS